MADTKLAPLRAVLWKRSDGKDDAADAVGTPRSGGGYDRATFLKLAAPSPRSIIIRTLLISFASTQHASTNARLFLCRFQQGRGKAQEVGQTGAPPSITRFNR